MKKDELKIILGIIILGTCLLLNGLDILDQEGIIVVSAWKRFTVLTETNWSFQIKKNKMHKFNHQSHLLNFQYVDFNPKYR